MIPCPYKKEHCTLRSPLLDYVDGGGICKISQCDCHEVDVAYDYGYSRDRVRDERHRRIREKYEELKKQNRAKQKEKREKRLEQKIVRNGWGSLEPFSPDYHHALKWFGQEKIEALERSHQKYLEEERNMPRQMSLFEFM